MKYFLPSEITSMTKEEICLQGVLGIQTCKTKNDVMNILFNIWNLGQNEERSRVKKVIKDIKESCELSATNIFDEGYLQACEDILKELMNK